MSQQPFEGIRVVEFGQFVAVPVAAQLLADGGAEVIKVEALGGDAIRFLRGMGPGETRHFICRNNGKHCLPLALKEESAKPVIEALMEWADVVLMNMRPGLARKIGIAPEQLTERYPRIIFGSVSGFGSAGPEAGEVGQDVVLQSRSGLTASNGRTIDGRPAATECPIVDTMTAVMLAYGVASALVRRDRTGKGGIVETSLLQAALTMVGTDLSRAVDRDGAEHTRMLEQLAAKRAEGASFTEQFEAGQPADLKVLKTRSKIVYSTHATKDSFITVACGTPVLRKNFFDALGMVDESETPGFSADLMTYYTELLANVEQILASAPSDHWVAVLKKFGVPVSRVFQPIELFDDEHLNANKMLHTFEHPLIGAVTMVGPPVKLDDDGFRPGQPTQPFGSESEAILSQLGFSTNQINDLMTAGISHKGIKTPN